MTTKYLPYAGCVALAGILAGCSGMGSATPSAGNALVSQQTMAGGVFLDGSKCKESKGIKIKPCSVTLTVSNPTATVTVKYPSGDTITDKDKKCTKKDIATVEGANGTYDVTAGTKAGNCDVTFTVKAGKKSVGTGTLSITNKV